MGANKKQITIQLSDKTESHPLIIPVVSMGTDLPLASSELAISILAEAAVPGAVLISPPEVIVDQPIYYGCISTLTAPTGPPSSQNSPAHCLVHCDTIGKRFGLLQGTDCYCQNNTEFGKGVQHQPRARCDISCAEDQSSYCGGQSVFSAYIAGNNSGFVTFFKHFLPSWLFTNL